MTGAEPIANVSPPDPAPRLRWWWWGGIAVLLALRLPAVLANPVVGSDESLYLILAGLARDTPGVLLRHDHHPLFPAVLMPLVALGGEAAARWGVLACSVVLAWTVSGLARERFGAVAGVLGCWAVAVLPGPVEAGARVLSEAVYVPPLIGAMWALLRAQRTGSWLAAGAAGALAGLAYLARPEGLGPALVAAGALAALPIGGPAQGRWDWRRRVALVGAVVIGAVIVASPYMASIGGLTRKKRMNLAIDLKTAQAGGAQDPLSFAVPRWTGSSDLPSGEHSPATEWLEEWAVSTTPLLWAVLLGGLAWWCVRRRRPQAMDGALAGVVCLYFLVHGWLVYSAGYLAGRHVWPVSLFLVPWAAATLEGLLAWRPARWPAAGRVLVAATAIAFSAVGVTAAGWAWRADRPYLRAAGLALRPLAPTAVFATDTRVPYYAGARTWVLGRTDAASLLQTAREQHVRYVAADLEVLRERVGEWQAVLDAGARLVAEFPIERHAGEQPGRFVVYDLLP